MAAGIAPDDHAGHLPGFNAELAAGMGKGRIPADLVEFAAQTIRWAIGAIRFGHCSLTWENRSEYGNQAMAQLVEFVFKLMELGFGDRGWIDILNLAQYINQFDRVQVFTEGFAVGGNPIQFFLGVVRRKAVGPQMLGHFLGLDSIVNFYTAFFITETINIAIEISIGFRIVF